jgi:hemerythrin-like domain-containing protein
VAGGVIKASVRDLAVVDHRKPAISPSTVGLAGGTSHRSLHNAKENDMASTDAPQRPHSTQEMIAVHRVFRRESALMPQLVRAVPDGNTSRATLIAEAFRDYQLGLHIHHTGEDTFVWPLLLARVDLDAEMVLRMEPEHEVLARSMEEVDRALPAWEAVPSAATAGPVLAALSTHRDVLHEHLADEETNILPLIEEHLTVAEWAKLGQHFAKTAPANKRLLFLGALLEEVDPAESAILLGALPPPVRLAWRLIGRRQYARRLTLIRADLAR